MYAKWLKQHEGQFDGVIFPLPIFAKGDPGSGRFTNEGRIRPFPATLANCRTRAVRILVYASEAEYTDDLIEEGYFDCAGACLVPGMHKQADPPCPGRLQAPHLRGRWAHERRAERGFYDVSGIRLGGDTLRGQGAGNRNSGCRAAVCIPVSRTLFSQVRDGHENRGTGHRHYRLQVHGVR